MRVELLAIFIDQKSLECLSPKSISLCKSAAGSDWGPEPFGRAHQASHRGDWLMQRGCQPRQRRPKQPPDCGGSHSSGMVLGVVIRGSKKYLNLLVGVAGFEPATPASRTQCSTGLSHTPTENAAYSLGFRAPQGAEFRI